MEGIIVSYRRGRHTQYPNQAIVRADGVENRADAHKLLGKKVIWKSPGKRGKEIVGKVTAVHGNSGAVRVRFRRGIPGQALGSKVRIL